MFLTDKTKHNKIIKISDNLSLDLNNLADPFTLKRGELFCFSSISDVTLKPETRIGAVLRPTGELCRKYKKPDNYSTYGVLEAFTQGRRSMVEFIIWQNETDLIQYFLWELEHHLKTEKDIIELFSVGCPIIVGISNVTFV